MTTGDGERVLVVEAERHLARLVQVNLGRQGYIVTIGRSGHEAIRLLTEQGFELAVIDRDLPDLNDLRACIRVNERTQSLRIIMLGDNDDDAGPPGPTAGANLWLTKPSGL